MDNSCIKYTYVNASKWFKKEIPHDALTNMYRNIDIDDETIRIDFPFIKGKLQCKIFNSDRECVELDSLKVCWMSHQQFLFTWMSLMVTFIAMTLRALQLKIVFRTTVFWTTSSMTIPLKTRILPMHLVVVLESASFVAYQSWKEGKDRLLHSCR